MKLEFNIISWAAWAPEYQSKDAWKHWSHATGHSNNSSGIAPKLSKVPAMQRRRYSRLTKMMLEVAFQCEPVHSVRSIFASRHGELNRTITLLEDIIDGQSISPIGFSQSVHNTASGIFGILTDNKTSTTSIAAGVETFSQALIEAYAQLKQDSTPLLIVFADDPVPPIYDEYTDELELPLAICFEIALATPQTTTKLAIDFVDGEESSMTPQLSYCQLIASIASKASLSGRLSGKNWTLTHAS